MPSVASQTSRGARRRRRLLPLPLEVIYELGLSPAVRLAADETGLTGEQLDAIAHACWRAITRPEPARSEPGSQ